LDIDRIKGILKKVVASLPAGVPYAGPIYAQYLSQLSSEEQRALFNELTKLSEDQYDALSEQLRGIWQINRAQIELTTKLLEELIAQKPEILKLVAVIPTGGRASSMYPLSLGTPKTLLIINTKPMLHHILDSLEKNKDIFSRVIVLTSEFSATVEAAVEPYRPHVECKKIERNVPAALLEMRDELQAPFLLHYNDVLTDNIDWNDVYKHYIDLKRKHSIIGMLLCSMYYPLRIGVITEGPPRLVQNFEEKPDHLIGMYANTGTSVLDPAFLRHVRRRDRGIYEDSMKRALEQGEEKFGLYQIDKWWHVHSVNDYYDMQKKYYPKEVKA